MGRGSFEYSVGLQRRVGALYWNEMVTFWHGRQMEPGTWYSVDEDIRLPTMDGVILGSTRYRASGPKSCPGHKARRCLLLERIQTPQDSARLSIFEAYLESMFQDPFADLDLPRRVTWSELRRKLRVLEFEVRTRVWAVEDTLRPLRYLQEKVSRLTVDNRELELRVKHRIIRSLTFD
jgi:hypothetical protein